MRRFIISAVCCSMSVVCCCSLTEEDADARGRLLHRRSHVACNVCAPVVAVEEVFPVAVVPTVVILQPFAFQYTQPVYVVQGAQSYYQQAQPAYGGRAEYGMQQNQYASAAAYPSAAFPSASLESNGASYASLRSNPQVQQILRQNCQQCHGANDAKGGVVLLDQAGNFVLTKNGRPLSKARIWDVCDGAGGTVMPPNAVQNRSLLVNDQDMKILRAWMIE